MSGRSWAGFLALLVSGCIGARNAPRADPETPNGGAVQLRMAEPSQRGATPEFQSNAAANAGRLPPELIQKVVREHYLEFRHCYDAGLGRNAKLEGHLEIRFVIERDGSVKSASELADDNFPDPQVGACVVSKFRTLVFPQPDGGIVTVVYPIMLSPG